MAPRQGRDHRPYLTLNALPSYCPIADDLDLHLLSIYYVPDTTLNISYAPTYSTLNPHKVDASFIPN